MNHQVAGVRATPHRQFGNTYTVHYTCACGYDTEIKDGRRLHEDQELVVSNQLIREHIESN